MKPSVADEELILALCSLLLIVSPFVLTIVALCLFRGYRRDVPYRILLGLDLLCCAPLLNAGFFLVRVNSSDAIYYIGFYGPFVLLILYGLARPFSWFDVFSWFHRHFQAAGRYSAVVFLPFSHYACCRDTLPEPTSFDVQ